MMEERNIRLTVAYDGTAFAGWQVQRDQRTVQGVLAAALERLHGHPVTIHGAGRTDAGVHAVGQVANFVTDRETPEAAGFVDAINGNLPGDVRVLASELAAPEFDARRSATLRVYHYYLYVAEVGFPHYSRYCWRLRRAPDLRRLNRLAAVLEGEHDFTAFAMAGDASAGNVRRVESAVFFPRGEFVVFRIAGNAFLRRMVRSVVGTIVELERVGAAAQEMERLLDARLRSQVGVTAPARGLFLQEVRY